jgi:hypothetical protein
MDMAGYVFAPYPLRILMGLRLESGGIRDGFPPWPCQSINLWCDERHFQNLSPQNHSFKEN